MLSNVQLIIVSDCVCYTLVYLIFYFFSILNIFFKLKKRKRKGIVSDCSMSFLPLGLAALLLYSSLRHICLLGSLLPLLASLLNLTLLPCFIRDKLVTNSALFQASLSAP